MVMSSSIVSNIDSILDPSNMSPNNNMIKVSKKGDGEKHYDANHPTFENFEYQDRVEDRDKKNFLESDVNPGAPFSTSETLIHKPVHVNRKFQRSVLLQLKLNNDFKKVTSPGATPDHKETSSSMGNFKDQTAKIAYFSTSVSEHFKGQPTSNQYSVLHKPQNPNMTQVISQNSSLHHGSIITPQESPPKQPNCRNLTVPRISFITPSPVNESPTGVLPVRRTKHNPVRDKSDRWVIQDGEKVSPSTPALEEPDEMPSEYYVYEEYEEMYEESGEYYYYEEIYEEEIGEDKSEEEPRIDIIHDKGDEPEAQDSLFGKAVVDENTVHNEQGVVTNKSGAGPSYRGSPACDSLNYVIFEQEYTSREDTPERMATEEHRRSFKLENQVTKGFEKNPIKDTKNYHNTEPYAEDPEHIDPNELNLIIVDNKPLLNSDAEAELSHHLKGHTIYLNENKKEAQNEADIYIEDDVFLKKIDSSRSSSPAEVAKLEVNPKEISRSSVGSKTSEDDTPKEFIYNPQKELKEVKQNEPMRDNEAPSLPDVKNLNTEQIKEVSDRGFNIGMTTVASCEQSYTFNNNNTECGVQETENPISQCEPSVLLTTLCDSKAKIDKSTLTDTLIEVVPKTKKKTFFISLFDGCAWQKKGIIATNNREIHSKKR
ncbi:unnamed protein product [Phytomonas sp. Hart1]|nr:unnamed protein product [Phytomonas sp. Hart1]|eukprot:CCW66402.1 unnamed protein product [Phytomonas sp. isolate Hart1]